MNWFGTPTTGPSASWGYRPDGSSQMLRQSTVYSPPTTYPYLSLERYATDKLTSLIGTTLIGGGTRYDADGVEWEGTHRAVRHASGYDPSTQRLMVMVRAQNAEVAKGIYQFIATLEGATVTVSAEAGGLASMSAYWPTRLHGSGASSRGSDYHMNLTRRPDGTWDFSFLHFNGVILVNTPTGGGLTYPVMCRSTRTPANGDDDPWANFSTPLGTTFQDYTFFLHAERPDGGMYLVYGIVTEWFASSPYARKTGQNWICPGEPDGSGGFTWGTPVLFPESGFWSVGKSFYRRIDGVWVFAPESGATWYCRDLKLDGTGTWATS